jgi:glycosyltransferase involved in cell wall biosynthesis
MKVALVSQSYAPAVSGGGDVDLKLQTKCLIEGGHEVTVLTFNEKARLEETISGVRISRYSRLNGLTAIAQLLTLLPQVAMAMRQWQGRIDLFHIYHPPALSGAGLYKMLGGEKPIVASLESYAGFCPLGSAICHDAACDFAQRVRCLVKGRNIALKALSIPYAAICPVLISLAKMADRYIALSQTVKELYVAHGYNADRIDVIPSYIEERTDSSTFGVAPEQSTFNILYVGALNQSKGIDILIQAFSRLANHDSRLRLTIVGDGPQAKSLKELAWKLGINEQVLFAGWVSHEFVGQYYRTADVFVHPGIWAEPFGRTTLEAMQFQVPLVVSSIGAPPEVVGDAGLVFEKSNVEDLAEKLQLIYRDEGLRQELSSNCSKVLQNYSRDKIIDRIITVYQQVLDRQ